ncbi:MAG: histidine--tRNA ligase [Lentisphaerae bacterium GWF2_57_35]|nr:MAG: histidine--tRNA ligase [Lentisphaerae bacterium GWF2_57_35]
MSDLSAPEIRLWQEIEGKARRILSLYGYEEIRTPVLEYTSVFTRSIGDATDIVQKEMYTFEDRGGRQISLRPEGTASVMRYAAGLGPEAEGLRLYYIGPMFRCERPQAGRKRQFHQLGSEMIGQASPAADVETLALQMHLLSSWGLEGCSVEINTRGLPEDRQAVAEGLAAALQPHREALCEDCRRRFDANILRILDCKKDACKKIADGLPPVTDFMSEASRQYLDEVKRLLDLLNIPVRLNPRLVRGLDYYVHTVWEITHGALGAQNAIAGGGRYRMEMDGRTIDGVGFAMGLERVVSALQAALQGQAPVAGERPVWLVSMGQKAFEENMVLAQTLRLRGLSCGFNLTPGSMKSQMRAANRAQAAQAIIRGDREIESGAFLLKNMADGVQQELDMPALLNTLLDSRIDPAHTPAKAETTNPAGSP